MFAFKGDVKERQRKRKKKNEIIECKYPPRSTRLLCVSCMEIYSRLKHNIET